MNAAALGITKGGQLARAKNLQIAFIFHAKAYDFWYVRTFYDCGIAVGVGCFSPCRRGWPTTIFWNAVVRHGWMELVLDSLLSPQDYSESVSRVARLLVS